MIKKSSFFLFIHSFFVVIILLLSSFDAIAQNSLVLTEEGAEQEEFQYNKPTESRNRASKSISSSILASGKWHKIQTSSTGFYKITYSDLLQMGINPNDINPKKIQLFGLAGGLLPESTSDFIYPDLQELAIEVFGESDGIFDPADYIIFYAVAPNKWVYNTTEKLFTHKKHYYSDYTYYFIRTDNTIDGKRIVDQAPISALPTQTITSFNDFQIHELEQLNLIKSGRIWYGELFNNTLSYTFTFNFPNLITTEPVKTKIMVAARSDLASIFSLSHNGQTSPISISKVNTSDYNGDYAKEKSSLYNFTTTGDNLSFSLSYNKPSMASLGWLDYLEVNVLRALSFTGQQMAFRNVLAANVGQVSSFSIANASAITSVYNVTNPLHPIRISLTTEGTTKSFISNTDSIIEFVATDGLSYPSPTYIGPVANQNLAGLTNINYVIISPPPFMAQANELAELHRTNSGLTVEVVDINQIYNEYSSGVVDPTAIRNFLKNLYEKSDSIGKLRYLLLLGDGSYDPKNRLPNNTYFIPSYQSYSSLRPTNSYVTDDYFGLLNANEGYMASNYNLVGALDIGIGRFPVNSVTDAQQMVDKVKRYLSTERLDAGEVAYNTVSNYDDWKNVICFIADDEDDNLHLNQANEVADELLQNYPVFNVDKIFIDAYLQESSANGQRYPSVTADINRRVDRGALLINYTGHGGEEGLAHERIIGNTDILSWTNKYNMPVFVTATCEFSRFDDPKRTSAGEYVVLNPNGGAVASFTTTRVAFSSSNQSLVKNFYANIFKPINGVYPRLGDVLRIAKTVSGSGLSLRNFILLGDPALQLAYPKHQVVTTKINNIPVAQPLDTLKALSTVTVEGEIQDVQSQLISSFNGVVYITVFDKISSIKTLANDGADSTAVDFSLQKSIIFKGKASVINGKFSFTCMIPKDIAYNFDYGKISYYAASDSTDAHGYFNKVTIGGSSDEVIQDEQGPKITLYINDDTFVSGGITNESPILLAYLEDENGLNTIGSGIGHDMIAILDDNTQQAIILNDYFKSNLNSYTQGEVRYPLSNLAEGKHTLTLKAWDLNNNSSTVTIEFFVSTSQRLSIKKIVAYPNPFEEEVTFKFEHNQPFKALQVDITIYDIMGTQIKHISEAMTTEGYRSNALLWDGTQDNGAPLEKGVYIYKMNVSSTTGDESRYSDKLILIK